jgi:hypothetical protein
MQQKLQRDVVVHRILSNPGWIEHGWIGSELLYDTYTGLWDDRRQEYHPAWPPSVCNEWQKHSAGGVSGTDYIRRLFPGSPQRFHDCPGMESRTFGGPGDLKGRRESTVAAALQGLNY